MANADMSYIEAMHAIQSGIAAKMTIDDADTQPKHLRVGVDSAMVNDHAIAELLIAKGVFTLDEYREQVRRSAIVEVERSEAELKALFGREARLA